MRPLNISLAADEFNLLTALRALRRRKGLVLGTVLAVNLVVAGVVALIPSRYIATATLMIDPADPRVLEGRSVAKPLPDWVVGDNSVMTTQINLVKSPELAAQVITALGLERNPELLPDMPLLARLRGWASDLVSVAALAQWWPPLSPAEPQTEVQAAVPGFLARLSVGQQGDSRMIAIAYSSGNPVEAARVANAVARQYVDTQVAYKTDVTERAFRWMSERVAEQRTQVEKAEAEVATYMATNGLAHTANGGLEGQQLSSLQAELVVARADRAAKEARLAQLRDLEARGVGYASLPEVGASHIIEVLQQEAAALHGQEAQRVTVYGPNHPTVLEARAQRQSIDRRISQEIANIARGIADDADRARIREQAMEQSLTGGKEKYAGSERASVWLNELTRVAAAKSALYQTMLSRLNEIGEQRGLIEPDARLVGTATVPQERAFPKLGMMLGTGLMASILLGIGFVAMAEHLDRGLRTPRQVEHMLGLPNLALVPRVKRGRLRARARRRLHNYILKKPQSAYAESIRALHLGIERAGSRGPVQVLLVTSTWPGEGKTTLALSLGAMIARGGRRVVVVDLDLRHPNVARQLGCSVKAGLAEYVERGDALAEVVRIVPGAEARLHVIPTRAPVSNPADVLASTRLKALIADLRLRYDTVILDVPPSLAVTDALVVGALADAALFVVQWGATTDVAAFNGLTALEKAGVDIVGCALTLVDPKQQSLYGYHDAGGYSQKYRQYFIE